MCRKILKTESESGFTMMELIVVLAIISVISAIMLPGFFSTADRTRLKSDIISLKNAQNALDLYIAENNTTALKTAKDTIEMLKINNYLNNSKLQTDGAQWNFNSQGKLEIDISNCETKIKEIVPTLTKDEQETLKTG